MFYYDGKTDTVQQWVEHPVADKHGYGDGYWRKSRPAIAARVRHAVDKIMKHETVTKREASPDLFAAPQRAEKAPAAPASF